VASTSTVRVTDLLAALSLTVDLGLGQSVGHVARAAVVAGRLNDRLGRPVNRRTVFEIAMLGWVGCIADSREAARWFGDDIEYRAGVYDLDLSPLPFLGYLLRHAGRSDPPLTRAGKKAAVLLDAGRSARESLRAHCQVTAQVAARLGMSEPVCAGLTQIFARWDGKGLPSGLAGDDIARPVRMWQLADVVEVHHSRGGSEAVRQVCLSRRGSQFDPELVDVLLSDVDGLLAGLAPTASWEDVLARERDAGPPLATDALDGALEAIADWIDLKSAWFTGHCRNVAELAGAAAQVSGLDDAEVALVTRAALLSDIGRAGVPNTVWDKAEPLSSAEAERIRMHSYFTERSLERAGALDDIAEVAAMAHERLDGSGYHRGLTAAAIPMPARVLAAADVYQTKLEPRPHRPALDWKAAAAHLQAEAAAGRLDGTAVAAVLDAAGHESTPVAAPRGLTPREVDVLGLIARGLTNRQVARRLGISPKTVSNHVEHIYLKAGVSTRAAATLFAMEHRLIR
jgi:HD-GYP domain-containing protein (c-di-GMP phosphodiesterase class II)